MKSLVWSLLNLAIYCLEAPAVWVFQLDSKEHMSAKRFGIPKSMIADMTQDLTQKHVSDSASASRRSQWAKQVPFCSRATDGWALVNKTAALSTQWQGLLLRGSLVLGHRSDFLVLSTGSKAFPCVFCSKLVIWVHCWVFSSNWNLASHYNTKQDCMDTASGHLPIFVGGIQSE